MKCPECTKKLKKIEIQVEGAESKAISYQCDCGYAEFEKESAAKVVKELKLKESPLKIKQKIVKLSGDRLGFYFNSHIVRSLKLKPGEEVYVSVPDKKHIVLKLEE
ncbi:MAG: hypothetical protein HY514_03210 [Candidatus Aenigmarchaeota archaeon]|nr:hypothetical protein [Candidatus Aenigmarchaeota archaeon]